MSNDVKITGVEIPFLDLVWLLVKLAIAVIPATIILIVVSALLYGLLAWLV